MSAHTHPVLLPISIDMDAESVERNIDFYIDACGEFCMRDEQWGDAEHASHTTFFPTLDDAERVFTQGLRAIRAARGF